VQDHVEADEEASFRSWKWEFPSLRVSARASQEFGEDAQLGAAEFECDTAPNTRVHVQYGTTLHPRQTASGMSDDQGRCRLRLPDLRPRATGYTCRFILERNGDRPRLPVVSFKTLFRYEYLCSFSEADPQLRHKPGEPCIIEPYSVVNVDHAEERLGRTSARAYLQHIIHSITSPEMSQMEKGESDNGLYRSCRPSQSAVLL